jgi:hypothetical protein
MIITFSTDSNYIKHSSRLLKSIAVNSPHLRVHCRAIDCTEYEIQLLQSSHPNVIIVNEQLNLSTKRQYFRAGTVLSTDLYKRGPHGAHLLSYRQCFVSNTRYRNILHCLETLGEDTVILLDADAIVRKNLCELQAFIDSYDVCCNVGTDADRYPNRRCWECSCIIVKNTKNAIDFFNAVKQCTESTMTDWDSDQFAIENVYAQSKNSILLCEKIHHIEDLSWRDVTLHNWQTLQYEYSPDSYIWPGSGEAKFTSTYLKERNKYSV